MSSTVKKFFEDWQLKFGVWPELKMKNKIGAAFATGGHVKFLEKTINLQNRNQVVVK